MVAIYLYKVTFEETNEFYWGIHLQRKEKDGYLGSPITHSWKWNFYTPKLDILHYFDPTDEGWEEACLVEKRVIKPDLNNPLCLNENCGGNFSLRLLKESSKKGGSFTKKRHEELDQNGRSKFAKRNSSSLMRPVEVIDINCGIGFVFESINEAAKCFGLSYGNLRETALEGGKRKQTKGFKARFI